MDQGRSAEEMSVWLHALSHQHFSLQQIYFSLAGTLQRVFEEVIGRRSESITVGQKNEMKRENETEGKTFGISVLIF